jgi:hypothetical protein
MRLQLRRAGLACLLVSIVAGCSTEPYAAADHEPLGDPEPPWQAVLSDSQQREVDAAMISVAAESTIVQRPQRAPHGVRWSDVEFAAIDAAAEVEMAVVRTQDLDDGSGGYEFILKTIDDRRAKLMVRRLESDRVYEAAASVGRFGDDRAAEKKLLAAFDRLMHEYGNKRQFEGKNE